MSRVLSKFIGSKTGKRLHNNKTLSDTPPRSLQYTATLKYYAVNLVAGAVMYKNTKGKKRHGVNVEMRGTRPISNW